MHKQFEKNIKIDAKVFLHKDNLIFDASSDEQWIEATITLMTPGVYNDSYFSADVLREFDPPELPVPVTFGHICNELANRPDIYIRECMGNVFRIKTQHDSLVGDAVVDQWKLLSKLGEENFKAALEGEPIDISIGIYANFDITDDEDYIIVKHFSINHVALLYKDQAACSVEDGCGMKAKSKNFILSEARTPTYDATETVSWANVDKTLGNFIRQYYGKHADNRPDTLPTSIADLSQQVKTWIVGHTLLGDAQADMERDLIFFPVVNPNTGKLNQGALMAVMSGRGSEANIGAAAKKSAKDKALYLYDKEFKEKNMEIENKVEETKKIDVELAKTENVENKEDVKAVIAESVNDAPAMVADAADFEEFKEFKNSVAVSIAEKIKADVVALARLPISTLTAIKNAVFAETNIQVIGTNDEKRDMSKAADGIGLRIKDADLSKDNDFMPMPKCSFVRK